MKRQGPPHGKLFSTLVLMSSSLAFGCGGDALTNGDQVTGSGGMGGSQDSEGSGGSSSGGSDASGGDSSGDGGTGGATGGAGGDTGGMGGMGLSVEPGPFDCPLQQVECSTSAQCFANEESSGRGLVLPNGCSCNEERPLEPEDCGEEEKLFCLLAVGNGAGQSFTEEVAFQCECVPFPEDRSCISVCGELTGVGYAGCRPPDESDQSEDEWSSVLCGCAIPILR